jgi:hypothetical protein
MWCFKPLKKLMSEDFGCFCRKKNSIVEPIPIDTAFDTAVHFDYLSRLWEKT